MSRKSYNDAVKADPVKLARRRELNRAAVRRYKAAHPAETAAYRAEVWRVPAKRAATLARLAERRKMEAKRFRTSIYQAIVATVSRNIPTWDRDDIIMGATEIALRTMPVRILRRTRKAFHVVAPDDPRIVAAVTAALKVHRRMFSMFNATSLDAPIGEGGFTLMDTLAAPEIEEIDEDDL